MKGDKIFFRTMRKYKYELIHAYMIDTGIVYFPGMVFQHGHPAASMGMEGNLTIMPGYLWDGPSGIAKDTLSFMRASLVHDALYHLMRENVLKKYYHRCIADRLMRKICFQDGMNPARANYTYLAVRAGGKRSASYDKPTKEFWAPRDRNKAVRFP